jgi:hypothetical protein
MSIAYGLRFATSIFLLLLVPFPFLLWKKGVLPMANMIRSYMM